MTTSGITTGQMTVAGFVTKAMKEIGALSSGESPTGSELIDGIEAFNWMLKSLAAEGADSFNVVEATATFAADTATITLSPYVNDVIEARVVQSATFQRPLQRWERGQYLRLPNKAAPGTPTAYTVTQTTGATSLTLWPVPVASTDVKYTAARTLEDVTDGAETVDLPQMWTETAYLMLASRLANMFGATRTDPAAVQRIDQAAGVMLNKMLDYDRPASIYMGNARGRII